MIMNIESLHDGLTQRVVFNYSLEDSHRVLGNMFERVVELNLPLFLTHDVWKRHNYSITDITTTLEYFSALHLWQCALLYGISPSNSAVKLAFSTPESMVYGSKAIVIRKIRKVLIQSQQFAGSTSVLDMKREDHIPPIPIHNLNQEMWDLLVRNLPQKPVDLLDVIEYVEGLYWNGVLMVPIWFEKGAIYAVRVVHQRVFDACGRVKYPALSNKPLHILIDQDTYCGVEEACFFIND